MPVVPLPEPSWRIRAYLGIRAAIYLWYTYTYIVSDARLSSNPSFDILKELMPVRWFGAVFVILGVASLGGVVWPAERPTRILLGLSAMVSVLFGVAILFAGTKSPGVASFIGLGLIDLLLVGADYRSRR